MAPETKGPGFAITAEQLRKAMPRLDETRAVYYVRYLNPVFERFRINTPQRAAAFLAQLAHESGELRWRKELASGAAYEGRADLGNTNPGDGVRYKGRGWIQITGRLNYQRASRALGVDFLKNPRLMEELENAALVSGWFWAWRGLNELADLNTPEAFEKITKRINGGLNGYAERKKYWARAKEALGC